MLPDHGRRRIPLILAGGAYALPVFDFIADMLPEYGNYPAEIIDFFPAL